MMDTGTYLPPKYSLNSFFVRHVAHPKRMKYISGLNNAKICAVNDIGYYQSLPGLPTGLSSGLPTSSPVLKTEYPSSSFNDELARSNQNFKRKEKAVPPNGIWQTYGLIDNTDHWRAQLNSLASSVGLLTQNDIDEYKKKKDRDEMIKNLQKNAQKPSTSQSRVLNSAKGTAGSTRLNEPLLTGRRVSRQSRQSRGVGLTGSKHYIVDQSDREIWMLQVLCQILQTDNLTDIKSWLVSTSDQEKERVKQLIDSAMKGLEESGRITETAKGLNEPPKTSSFAQLNDESKTKSSLAYIEDALQKVELNKATKPDYGRENTKLPNILKIEDEDTIVKNKLQAIPEVLKMSDDNLGKTKSPAFFKINMHPKKKGAMTKRKEKEPLENASVIFEAPTVSLENFKIEKVKVSMLVKDKKTKTIKEIAGDWKSNSSKTKLNSKH